MTVELITGHAGSAHISAADAGWFNVGVVGEGKYVLDTGTQFACNVQSANLVTIGIGDALFEGRHVRVSATENVALDNGAQGVNRNDLICIKYEYNSSTSVETASLEVLKGTAVSGTPSDPTIPSGSILEGATAAYMPLWRIPISGITVGEPVKLYGEVLTTLEDVATKALTVDQIPDLPASKISSGTLPVARGGTGKTSGTCYMVDVLYNNTSGSTGTITLSASAANYTEIEIMYRATTDNMYNSVRVPNPNGKTAQFVSVMCNQYSQMSVKSKVVKINGTTIAQDGYAGYSTIQTGAFGYENGFYIHKVLGYK